MSLSNTHYVLNLSGWWIGASEETGVTPNNNDIESFWELVKHVMLEGTRVGHRQLLEETFPQMLFLLSPEYVGGVNNRRNRCVIHV